VVLGISPKAWLCERVVLRIQVQSSAAAARSYYAESRGEYYAEGQEEVGVWGGRIAAMLGLQGRVEREAFARLCGNEHPKTGQQLTPRTKLDRRVGMDVNFHCPKSVSVLYGLTADPEILAAFRAAVAETMTEWEVHAQTRIRRGGAATDRTTSNLLWAEFVHVTARPVADRVDPHLHAHCFVFNLTHDDVEGRFKALQAEELFRYARYAEAAFHARLAKRLCDLGFDVSRTAKGWEVSGIPDSVLKRFSRRSALIEMLASQEGITDAKTKDALGARSREGKRLDLSLGELRADWWAQLTTEETAAIYSTSSRVVLRPAIDPLASLTALRSAAEHHLEREAVVSCRQVSETALRFGVGMVTPESLKAEAVPCEWIVRKRDGEMLLTTQEVLAEEQAMLAFCRQGRGTCRPLRMGASVVYDPKLSSEQRDVVEHVLTSPDRVMVIRGAAGTGKTTLLKECVQAIEASGRRVILLAPTSEAARGVLRGEGFSEADTIARFLLDTRFQATAQSGVLWIDEAGLVGNRDMARLFSLANRLEARVILSGDRYQHRSVARGSVLRLLETEAGLVPLEVKTIRRQRGRYRDAVQCLSAGQVTEGLAILEELGWVRELADSDRNDELAREYLSQTVAGKSVLVVAPTHAEGRAVTTAIREALREAGRLPKYEQLLTRLEARNLTTEERRRSHVYEPADIIEFHANAPGFRAGQRWTVLKAGRGSLAVTDGTGQTKLVPYTLADRFQVYRPVEAALSIGDRIRITKNARSAKGEPRLDNGSLHVVAGLTAEGEIRLESGAVLKAGFGHWMHGYVVTSHAAQGKTVDVVLIAESSHSFPAASREQFYVSVSRGRQQALVFTDNLDALPRAIARSDPQPTATELIQAEVPSRPRWQAWLFRRVQGVRRVAANLTASIDPRPRSIER
jgi:conjugative relaxase-like TrwC/TraI family protein